MGESSQGAEMVLSMFVSYAFEDRVIASQVLRSLRNSPVKAFVAEHDVHIGQPLAIEVLRAIKESDLFLLLWSRNSRASAWVLQETGAAQALQKTILPFILHRSLNLPAFLEGLRYISAYPNLRRALAQLRKHLRNLQKQKRPSTQRPSSRPKRGRRWWPPHRRPKGWPLITSPQFEHRILGATTRSEAVALTKEALRLGCDQAYLLRVLRKSVPYGHARLVYDSARRDRSGV
jgi:hypothetical protein